MCIYCCFSFVPLPKPVNKLTRHRPLGQGRGLGHGMACYGIACPGLALPDMACRDIHVVPWLGMPHGMPRHGMSSCPLPSNSWQMSCNGFSTRTLHRIKREMAIYISMVKVYAYCIYIYCYTFIYG